MREAFEMWYRTTYWDYNYGPIQHAKYLPEKDAYTHMDVDLAYQAWKAACQYTKDINNVA